MICSKMLIFAKAFYDAAEIDYKQFAFCRWSHKLPGLNPNYFADEDSLAVAWVMILVCVVWGLW